MSMPWREPSDHPPPACRMWPTSFAELDDANGVALVQVTDASAGDWCLWGVADSSWWWWQGYGDDSWWQVSATDGVYQQATAQPCEPSVQCSAQPCEPSSLHCEQREWLPFGSWQAIERWVKDSDALAKTCMSRGVSHSLSIKEQTDLMGCIQRVYLLKTTLKCANRLMTNKHQQEIVALSRRRSAIINKLETELRYYKQRTQRMEMNSDPNEKDSSNQAVCFQ